MFQLSHLISVQSEILRST